MTATAFSALNQALYDLLAKREQVPIWRLFAEGPGFSQVPLYTTINWALQTRTNQEYVELLEDLAAQGFRTFKCAPFERVEGRENAVENSAYGLETLDLIRQRFPDIGIRVDFSNPVDNRWVDVIMPDVKHVGGFGPLLKVLEIGQGRIEVSPHNPSGPISTAASLHAGVLFPETVRSLEYAFDRLGSPVSTGEVVEDGQLHLTDRPGWGVEPLTR